MPGCRSATGEQGGRGGDETLQGVSARLICSERREASRRLGDTGTGTGEEAAALAAENWDPASATQLTSRHPPAADIWKWSPAAAGPSHRPEPSLKLPHSPPLHPEGEDRDLSALPWDTGGGTGGDRQWEPRPRHLLHVPS